VKHFLIKLIVAGISLSAVGIAAATDLTPDQVKARLEAAGYTNVQIVRREGTHFDAKAIKGGKQVSLDVDGKTGAITPQAEGKQEKQDRPNP
jgi:predicted aspartyl protease